MESMKNVIELADIFTINNAKIRIGDKNDARSIEKHNSMMLVIFKY